MERAATGAGHRADTGLSQATQLGSHGYIAEYARVFCDRNGVSQKALIAFAAALVAWSFCGCAAASAAVRCSALGDSQDEPSGADKPGPITLSLGRTCLQSVRDFDRSVRDVQQPIEIAIAAASEHATPVLLQLWFADGHAGPAGGASDISRPMAIKVDLETGQIRIETTVDCQDARGEVSDFSAAMSVVLDQVLPNPDLIIDDIEVISAEARQNLFKTMLNDASAERAGRTLFETFEAAAARYADEPAISFGDRTLSYDAFLRQVIDYSDTLAARGVGNGTVVAVSFERSFELLIAVFAVLRLGAIYLPIDPKLPVARKSYILSNSGASLLLTPKPFAEALDWTGQEAPASAEKLPDDIAYMIYTSGSTGAPKGVMIDHRGILNRITWAQFQHPLRPGDVLLQKTNIMFDVSVWEMFGWFLGGATLHLLEPGCEADPKEILRVIRTKNVSVLHFVPSMLGAFLNYVADSGGGEDLPLRRIHASGEVLQPHHVENVFRLLGGPEKIELVNLYGPTEASVDVSFHGCVPSDAMLASVPIGRPIHNTGLYVLDARRKMLPSNVVGELYISGEGVGRGYVNLAKLTSEKFSDDPYRSGQRMYATGDRALWADDGTLKFLGRFDHQVKLRGFRIELPEIEAVISRLGAVSAVVARVVKDGSGDDRLVAWMIPRGDDDVDVLGLRRSLGEHLPDYMIPERFVVLEAFPIGRTGKVDRSALLNPFDEAVAPAATDEQLRLRLDRGSLVDQIIALWREILEIEDIADTTAFFDAGGNSMKALRLASRIERSFGVEVQVTSVFEYPSPRQYADHLENLLTGRTALRRLSHASAPRAAANTDIAIIGMSGRLPGAPNLEVFRDNIARGVESVRVLSDVELLASGVSRAEFEGPRYIKAKGVLDHADCFDAAFFGYAPREAERMDPQIRLLHEVVWAALEDAGTVPDGGSQRTGLFASASPNFYWLQMVMPSARSTSERYQLWLLNERDFLTTRVGHKLNFKGPCVTVQTACSSSLAAVHYARQALLKGDCEIAIAAGACLTYPLVGGYQAEEGMILSQDGHCRAFDASATGTVGGNGVAAIVMKPLRKALENGDAIRAVIKGSAINNDGADKVGFSAPSVAGQARVIKDAIAEAGFSSQTIRYLEAHGTGTPLGDPIEVEALKLAFDTSAVQFCGLGSVKANIGHLDAAAGIAGLIKAVHVAEARQVAPSVNFTEENAQLRLNQSPFYVTPHPVQPDLGDTPFRVGVSAFGMGGTNVHVVLERGPEPELSTDSGASWSLLPLSAKSPEALKAAQAQLADRLETEALASIADIAWTLQTGRRHFECRDFVVTRSLPAAILALRAKVEMPEPVSRNWPIRLGQRRPVAFVFTGQGSHFDSMGRELYQENETFRHTIDLCGHLLDEACGFKLAPFFGGRTSAPSDWTERTEAVQPVLFAFEYALTQVLRTWGIRPDIVTGHSLGEIVAACEAGVFSLADALAFVCARGRLMGEGPAGRMLSVRLPVDDVVKRLPEDLDVSAINDSRTSVVSGLPASIDAFKAQLADQGIHTRDIQSRFAFHSRHVEPMLGALRRVVSSFKLSYPARDLVSSVTGAILTPDEAMDPEYWVQQARKPVMFARAIDTIIGMDAGVIVELGPGQTLKNLILRDRRDIADVKIENLCPEEGEPTDEVSYLLAKAGELWKAGLDVDWQGLCPGEGRRKVSLPTYPFEAKRHWPAQVSQTMVEKPPRQTDPDKWFYAPSWQSGPLLAPVQSRSSWVVLADKDANHQALIDALSDQGEDIVLVHPGTTFTQKADRQYEIDPTNPDHFAELFQDLADRRRLPDKVLHLWCLGDRSETDEISEIIDRGYRALLGLGRAVGQYAWPSGLKILIVADRVEAIMDGDPVSPAHAAMYGVAKILPLENASISCRLIDCGALVTVPNKLAKIVLSEADDNANEPVVAYRGRRRWLKRYSPVEAAAFSSDTQTIRPGGIYLIIGGLGGMGLAFAAAIASVEPVTLVLASRRALPERHDWANLSCSADTPPELMRQLEEVQRLEMLGSKVVLARCDVSSPAEVQALVDDVRAHHGDINGVVHAAGLADYEGMVQRRDWQATQAVLAPKVQGTMNIRTIIPTSALDFVVLCSSIGNIVHEMKIGQSGYNAANEFLDACAQAFDCDEVAWVSINWTDWKDVGMTQVAIDYWRQQASTNLGLLDEVLQDAIDALEGGQVFLKALRFEGAQVIVSESDLAQRSAYVRALLSGKRDVQGDKNNGAGPRTKTTFESAGEVSEWLAKQWASQFGVETVDIHTNFFDAGANSLDLVQLHSRCCDELSIDLPLVSLYDYSTLDALSDHIFSVQQQATSAPITVQADKQPRLGEAKQGARERVKSIASRFKR